MIGDIADNNGVMKISVLGSGEGTTLQAILEACGSGRIPASVVLVISNNADSGVLRRARAAGVPGRHLSARTHPDPTLLDAALCEALVSAGTDLVFLAGYMKKLGPQVLAAFAGRILNTHPALLPNYGGEGYFGRRVHEAVLAHRESRTGVSIHAVTAEYDAGPVLAQAAVEVAPDDTVDSLMGRVQTREREFVVEVLGEFARGRRRLPVAVSAND